MYAVQQVSIYDEFKSTLQNTGPERGGGGPLCKKGGCSLKT